MRLLLKYISDEDFHHFPVENITEKSLYVWTIALRNFKGLGMKTD